MNKTSNKFTFVFDNKTNSWFVIDTKSDKYKFYARVFKKKSDKDWYDNFESNQKQKESS